MLLFRGAVDRIFGPVATDVGVQVRVTVGEDAADAGDKVVTVNPNGGVAVPVSVGDATCTGGLVTKIVGKAVRRGVGSVGMALGELGRGNVAGGPVGLGRLGRVSVAEGATVCVPVATWIAAKDDHRRKPFTVSADRTGWPVRAISAIHSRAALRAPMRTITR